jgi:hypothetical protein
MKSTIMKATELRETTAVQDLNGSQGRGASAGRVVEVCLSVSRTKLGVELERPTKKTPFFLPRDSPAFIPTGH